MINRISLSQPLRTMVIGGSLLFFSVLAAFALLAIKMDFLDSLNLDFNGFLAAESYPLGEEVAEVILSSHKAGHNGDEGLASGDVIQILKDIAKEQPRTIILALGTPELRGSDQDLARFVRESEQIPNLFYYSRWGEPSHRALNNTEPFSNFGRQVGSKYAIDTKLGGKDNKSRRLVLSMNGVDYDDELVGLAKVLNLPLPPLEQMPGTFKLFNSIQVYMRLYSEQSVASLAVDPPHFESLKGKIVFVGTRDAHSSLLGIHPFSRFDFFADQNTDHYFSEPSYLATVYGNLKTLSYVKSAGATTNQLWLVGILYVQLLLLWFFSKRPIRYLAFSFGALVLTWSFGLMVFTFLGVLVDFSRAALGTMVIQYLGIPVLFLRFLRRADRAKLEQDRLNEQQKIKNKFVLQSARADASLKIAAKISHDIRNPLMALQMATKFIKGQVSEDLESLLRESTLRLQGIADSTLNSYKEVSSAERTNLAESIQELIVTFQHLYPACLFETDIDADLKCLMPKYSLQRCLSNLMTNAIEAPPVFGRIRRVMLSGKADADSVTMEVRDNGPGISSEILGRLFQERATYGKRSGTGLGLFQVKEELDIYGGVITVSSSEEGAVFRIVLPLRSRRVPFLLSKYVLVFEEDGDLRRYLETPETSDIIFTYCQSLKEAETQAERIKMNPHDWTVLIDLSLNSDNETGLDLLEKIDKIKGVKTVLLTSLSTFPEMKALLDQYRVSCFSKSQLPYLIFSLRK
ncbi:ATP-binding protein [Bdellovibrio bacteriovorus]|uniref:hybrid sensor histidine kinase/response regulator n=1 Tax=Bdellovibrio bacteriovorus TaxID=959 RepID=UPI0021CFB3BD|nr:hybrid sensor histidine kinase/response regulator [Bdellovibrio bacteriovorus]UXR64300.1 ATP-binding protein [Bdellovibrio bacteriovorus]